MRAHSIRKRGFMRVRREVSLPCRCHKTCLSIDSYGIETREKVTSVAIEYLEVMVEGCVLS
jgi:hypothetical protein